MGAIRLLSALRGRGSVDPDALETISLLSITDNAEKIGVNDFFKDLKKYGLFEKVYALYPYYRDLFSTQKWNWKDRRDLDTAFRLIAVNDTLAAHNSGLGYSANGTNQHLRTNFIPSQHSSAGDLCLFSITRSVGQNATSIISEMGAYNATGGKVCRIGYATVNNSEYSFINTVQPATQNTSGIKYGFRAISAVNGVQMLYSNGNIEGLTYGGTEVQPTVELHICSMNQDGTASMRSANIHSFDGICKGLTYSELMILESICKKLMSVFNRTLSIPETNKSISIGLSGISTEGPTKYMTQVCLAKSLTQVSCCVDFKMTNLNIHNLYDERANLIPYKRPEYKNLFLTDTAYLEGQTPSVGFNYEAAYYVSKQLPVIINLAISRGWAKEDIVISSTYYTRNDTPQTAKKKYIDDTIKYLCLKLGIRYYDAYNYIKENGGDTLINTTGTDTRFFLTTAGETIMKDGFINALEAPIQYLPTYPTNGALNIYHDGDSLTFGTGSVKSYPQLLKEAIDAAYPDNQNTYYNGGIAGQTLLGMNANAAPEFDQYLKAGQNNIIFVWAYHNSETKCTTKEEKYTLFKNYCIDRKAAGWNRVIAITPQPSEAEGTIAYDTTTYETVRLYIRDQMLLEFPDLNIELIDIYNDINVGQPGAQNNLTYFNSDKIHMTLAAYQIISNYCYNKIFNL